MNEVELIDAEFAKAESITDLISIASRLKEVYGSIVVNRRMAIAKKSLMEKSGEIKKIPRVIISEFDINTPSFSSLDIKVKDLNRPCVEWVDGTLIF